MSSTLTILCPNGRRQQVKTTANTKILDIIDEVCKKQGFDPNEYDLIHARKPIDISLTYRLSGIPNNAQLELKKLESGPRQFQDVTLAIQLEDGSRLPQQQQFKPDSTSLFDVLNKFSQLNPDSFKQEILDESDDKYPSISYLNDQIIGLYQLKNTYLKDLALTSGRSILRFHLKQISQVDFDKLNQEFKENKLDKQNKLKEIYEKKLNENTNTSSRKESEIIIAEEVVTNHQAEKRMKYNDSDAEMKSIRSESQLSSYSSQNQQPMSVSPPVQQPRVNTPNEFANFKFPEETKGQILNDINELAEIEKTSKEPCDRMAVLFNLDEIESSKSEQESSSSELGDEFFDVTVHDLRFMLNDLKQRQNEDAPLMTKQMREMEQDRKAMKYSQIVVRIAFSNSRIVLQGLFRPKEKVSALYDFVRQFIHSDDELDLDFYLFTSPPKQILNQMKSTLFESKLCPASLVYFKNKSDKMPKFKDHEKITKSIKEANEIVYTQVHQTMRHDIENHEGMNWMKQEQSIVRNIFNKAANNTSGQTQYVDYESTSRRNDQSSNQDPVKQKLERFLKGGSKK